MWKWILPDCPIWTWLSNTNANTVFEIPNTKMSNSNVKVNRARSSHLKVIHSVFKVLSILALLNQFTIQWEISNNLNVLTHNWNFIKRLTLNWKVTEWVPKLASNWVLMLTLGGFPVAFCTTRKSLVTISITWPVWKTKSPFRLTASEERHPGMLACDRSSLVGEPCNEIYCRTLLFCCLLVVKVDEKYDWGTHLRNTVGWKLTARTWNTAMSSK